jgi:hypothetical protein
MKKRNAIPTASLARAQWRSCTASYTNERAKRMQTDYSSPLLYTEAEYSITNLASARVLEKVDMQLESRMRKEQTSAKIHSSMLFLKKTM